jgi:hypothetical protein
MRAATLLAALATCAVLTAPARAADDCRQWTGIWDVTYDNGTTSVWTIDGYDNNPDSEVILCTAQGAEALEGGAERPLYIMYIKFSKSYYFAYSADKPAHDTQSYNLFIEGETLSSDQKGLSGDRRPGSGPMPPAGCPAASLLGPDSRDAATLRLVRDRVLAQSRVGRWLVSLYYGHAAELDGMLDTHPAARAAAAAVLRQVARAAATALR